MPTYLTIHHETALDRVVLESRWTEIAKESRAVWQMTLYNTDQGKRFCEWVAPNPQVIEDTFRELGIKWSEIVEVHVTVASEWRLWQIRAGQEMSNCWEIMKCGKEPGAPDVDEKGVCPAAVDTQNWGKNRGRSAGRYCWKVVGTFCGGEVQGDFARKLQDCSTCEFFLRVKKEEGAQFER